jgi:hypothetical protein
MALRRDSQAAPLPSRIRYRAVGQGRLAAGTTYSYDSTGWWSEDRRYEFKNRLQLLPDSMNVNRPLQDQIQHIHNKFKTHVKGAQLKLAATNSKANSTTTRLPFSTLIFRGRRILGRRSPVGRWRRCDRGIRHRGIRCRRRLGRICRI